MATLPPLRRRLIWLEAGQPFPPTHQAWGADDPIPGLLAAGGTLDVPTLQAAYRQGVFPWFSAGEPILWWSTDPRMVLPVTDFKLQPSLRKTIHAGLKSGALEVRIDHNFAQVIHTCASSPRKGQNGTWILPEMVQAYCALHQAGHAHSIETWWQGELVGGLYCVALGRMVFGESMFSQRDNASKIALSALVAHCAAWDVPCIDCQQNTAHLASLGAQEIPRADFLDIVEKQQQYPAPNWQFELAHWLSWLERPHRRLKHHAAAP